MFYTGEYQQERKIKEEGIAEIYLPRGSNRLSFTTNEPFIYSYYVSDVIDEILKKNENCWEERAVFSNLTITEVKDKNYINNKISIIFKPNYKKSSTRYIILVAQKNEVNTLDNFKEPCFITKLLNERPEGLVVDQIYDIGITDTINAIVDISPITKLNENQEFLVNIISQELRFEKNINFYNPYEFKHTGKEKSKDGDDSYDDEPTSEVIPKDNEGSESASLALAIVVPILAVIIIILIVLLIFSRKINSSKRSKEEIEKLV